MPRLPRFSYHAVEEKELSQKTITIIIDEAKETYPIARGLSGSTTPLDVYVGFLLRKHIPDIEYVESNMLASDIVRFYHLEKQLGIEPPEPIHPAVETPRGS